MKHMVFLYAALAVPLFVGAQPRATDPSAPVPAVLYRSVFADTSTGVEMESADWKAANAQVGQFKNGHIDILKWEAAQPQPPAKGSTAMPRHHPMPAAAVPATGTPGTIKP